MRKLNAVVMILAVLLNLVVPVFSPERVAHAQGGGWGMYVNPFGDYTVDVGEKDPYGDDLDFGCYGNYANQWGQGSDSSAERWSTIDADGNITGGCHIVEGSNQNGRLIQGTLSGKYTASSNTISSFHLQTSETITNNIDGKISWGTATLTVDGSGSPNTAANTSHSHVVTGRFKQSYTGSEGGNSHKEGTVTIPVDVWPLGPSIQLDRSEAARFSAIKLTGSGFKKQSAAVKILFNGEEIYRVNADTNGQLLVGGSGKDPTIWIWVPDDAPLGVNKVWAESETGEKSAEVELKVTPVSREKLISNFNEIVKQYLAAIPKNDRWYTRLSLPGGWLWGGYGRNIANAGQTVAATAAEAMNYLPGMPSVMMSLSGYKNDLWPDNKFVCSWYQKEVLDFMDGIRFDPNPARRALMDGFDYGPFNSGPLDVAAGAHYYVTLWPHAAALDPVLTSAGFPASYETAGITFDPWPKQAPEVFALKSGSADWADSSIYSAHWTTGARYVYILPRPEPASIGYYKGRYPITGAKYYSNAKLARDYRSLVGIGSEPPKMLATHSPVALEFKDAQGHRAGMKPDGTLYSDIPDLQLLAIPKAEGGYEWYAALPEGQIDVTIIGTGSGEYQLQTKLSGQPILAYPPVTVTKGSLAHLALDDQPTPPPLKTADGQALLPQTMPAPQSSLEQAQPTIAATTASPASAVAAPAPRLKIPNGGAALLLTVGCGLIIVLGIGSGVILWRARRKPQPLRRKPKAVRPSVAAPIAAPAPPPAPLKLVVIQGTANRPWIELTSTALSIGRNPSNHLVIDHPLVSWQHARLDFVNGYWVLADLQSANGTFVNGVRIRQQVLRPGDQIGIGNTLLALQ